MGGGGGGLYGFLLLGSGMTSRGLLRRSGALLPEGSGPLEYKSSLRTVLGADTVHQGQTAPSQRYRFATV